MKEQKGVFLLRKETIPLCTTQQPWLLLSLSPYLQYKPDINYKGQLPTLLIPEILQPTWAPLTTRPHFSRQITAQQKFRPGSGMLKAQYYICVAIAGLPKRGCLNKVWGIWNTQNTQIKGLRAFSHPLFVYEVGALISLHSCTGTAPISHIGFTAVGWVGHFFFKLDFAFPLWRRYTVREWKFAVQFTVSKRNGWIRLAISYRTVLENRMQYTEKL